MTGAVRPERDEQKRKHTERREQHPAEPWSGRDLALRPLWNPLYIRRGELHQELAVTGVPSVVEVSSRA